MPEGAGADAGAKDRRQATRALALGAGLGLLLAALGLLRQEREGERLPPEAVARVGEVVILAQDFARLLDGLEQDRREPADAEMRAHVLDRMIDEELLIQRALDLGLAHLDRRVRADLTQSLIASVVSEVEDREPGEGELEAFYAENLGYFTRPGRKRVRQIFFKVDSTSGGDATRAGPGEEEALARAAAARQRLAASQDWAQIKSELGDTELFPLPDALLPAAKLRQYLGPTALRSILELEVGAVSEPVRSGTGVHLFLLVDETVAAAPPFEEIRAQVENEWRRREGDAALRRYLDDLRVSADVVISGDFE